MISSPLSEHAHDVGLLHDDEVLAVDFDLGARPLTEQHPVADLDVERMQLAVVAAASRPGRDDFALHWLFLGGIGDDDAALGLLLLLDAADQHAILQRSKLHGTPPSESIGSYTQLALPARECQQDRPLCRRFQAPHIRAPSGGGSDRFGTRPLCSGGEGHGPSPADYWSACQRESRISS